MKRYWFAGLAALGVFLCDHARTHSIENAVSQAIIAVLAVMIAVSVVDYMEAD